MPSLKGFLIQMGLLKSPEPTVYWTDSYDSWQEAAKHVGGYDAKAILDKVCEATQKVIRGEAAYERDSFLFYEKEYNYPLISYLLKCYLEENHLSILDFGGALGSSYFQNRDMLNGIRYKWNVVEQPHFIKYGQENIKEENLTFYRNVEEISDINFVLLSAVIHYIEDYEDLVKRIVSTGARYILIERTPLCDKEIICREIVHEPIYEASYVTRIMVEKNITELFKSYGYNCIDTWKSLVDGDMVIEGKKVEFKSLMFKFVSK